MSSPKHPTEVMDDPQVELVEILSLFVIQCPRLEKIFCDWFVLIRANVRVRERTGIGKASHAIKLRDFSFLWEY